MEPPDEDAMAQHRVWLVVMDLAAHGDRAAAMGATFDAFHERVAERENVGETPGVRLRAVVKRRLKGSTDDEKWLAREIDGLKWADEVDEEMEKGSGGEPEERPPLRRRRRPQTVGNRDRTPIRRRRWT